MKEANDGYRLAQTSHIQMTADDASFTDITSVMFTSVDAGIQGA